MSCDPDRQFEEEDRQFEEADTAVKQAVAVFMREIDVMAVKWEVVSHTYVIKRLLVVLSSELAQLIDRPDFVKYAGPEGLKLSNALADYRDARASDRMR